MPRIPIIRLGPTAEKLEPPELAQYTPAIAISGLQLGVDNLRHDVHLSFVFVDHMRPHIAGMILRHGNMEGLLAPGADRTPPQVRRPSPSQPGGRSESSDLKPLLAALHVSALNQSKAAENPSIDLLARLAIIKFLRSEINLQFAQLLERGRVMLKSYEGVRQQKALEYRERIAAFQIAKKIIRRKVGQDLFRTLREIDKETLGRMRRSLFGDGSNEAVYKLFLNPLLFTEDGQDAYLNAEHYVMLGNFEKDPDTFANLRRIACEFLKSLNLSVVSEELLDNCLNDPENANELVGTGNASDTARSGRAQKARLHVWTELLERERLLDYVIASYEVAPLLSEYSPRINAQQLKHALISRDEQARVEKLIKQHPSLTCESLYAAVARVSVCRGADRSRMASRFLRDFMRYHRDLRRLEAVNGAMDCVNLIGNQKIRDLSAMNGTLYEFLLAEERKATEEKIQRHVILKADIRDSSRLTRSLLEQEMNPASYFSLNFYDPVNKLLAKYGATKVFVEGDAVILALLEREGEAGLAVSRACVLAWEIIEIVRGYNQLLQRAGLPSLELGIGISLQESSPMYLMDGEDRIMISDALNESDRLSACSKRVRKSMERLESPFNVYAFQTLADADAAESPDDFILKYNVNGIRLSEAAFERLKQEIALQPCQTAFPQLWGSEGYSLHIGTVPIASNIFRKVVIRASRVAQIDPHTFALQRWSERLYYEVCSNPAVYAALEGKMAAGK